MTDATTQRHRHAHDHALEGFARSRGRDRVAAVRASLLESSAAARLLRISFVLAALWAGVYWALH